MVRAPLRHLERRGHAQQVEDGAEGPADGRSDVADLPPGGGDRHHLVRLLIGGLGAIDRLVEVGDELVGLLLLSEDLAEHGDLSTQLLVERLAVARV
ncbi:hypothetical protein ABE10_02665, partial [Bacillus toyonensis]|nr:hypothetical protein [Bacillus toyonensis]